MAHDEQFAARIRDVLVDEEGVTDRKMFGGLAVMVNGHMACGVVGNDLMLRLGEKGTEHALERPHVRPMDFTGRPAKAMVYVSPQGLRGRALRSWVEKAVAHARALPPKSDGT
jgi:TfoX/Sxy family transcriptional regulator of competence genes